MQPFQANYSPQCLMWIYRWPALLSLQVVLQSTALAAAAAAAAAAAHPVSILPFLIFLLLTISIAIVGAVVASDVHRAGTLHSQLCILCNELVLQEQQRQAEAAAEQCDTGKDAGEMDVAARHACHVALDLAAAKSAVQWLHDGIKNMHCLSVV
jgi:hypothetical protein